MFTGLVTDVGRITAAQDRNGVRAFRVEAGYTPDDIEIGASIMHSGVCLTVVAMGARPGGVWWEVEAVSETLSRTVLGGWEAGARANLELSLKLGDELGGHLVGGHVDGVGQVTSIDREGGSWRVRFEAPVRLASFLAEKGSVAVDGVSLTIAASSPVGSDPCWFEVAVIPHTLAATTLGDLKPGVRVNLEVDLIARYVARMLEGRSR
ncbi:riboflavin synthase [bacterium]|nr:riboflavin synthase [bacterium]